MLSKVKNYFYIYKYFGLTWIIYRLLYSFQNRFDFIKNRNPLTSYPTNLNITLPEIKFGYLDNMSHSGSIAIADDIISGKFKFFSHKEIDCSFPPDWHKNYIDNITYPREHWADINEFGLGDVKIVWELNRFGWVYDLIRAYDHSKDKKYITAFWSLINNWMDNNPPNLGINWKCGQEIAFRIMACCFALIYLKNNAESDNAQLIKLTSLIYTSANRIETNINYAISQNNNHSISEAMGLWTVGVLFPKFNESKQWAFKGKKLLEKLGEKLIYSDGAFSQQSVNYQRVMLQDYLWVFSIAKQLNISFSEKLNINLKKSYHLLYQLQPPHTGSLPRYGQNDGALILPLNNCDYADFRPVIHAWHYYFTGTRCYSAGPWDEDIYWLFDNKLDSAILSAPDIKNDLLTSSGYLVHRNSTSFYFTRCGKYQHRPAQADQCHIDLWLDGENILLDPGTFSYNGKSIWQNPFAETKYHNSLVVDNMNQMEKLSRFIWLPWVTGYVKANGSSQNNNVHLSMISHNGYKNIAYQRVIIALPDAQFLILDFATSKSIHNYQINYLMPEKVDRLNAQFGNFIADVKIQEIISDEKTPYGWYSPYYYSKKTAKSIILKSQSDKSLFYGLFGKQECKVSFCENSIKLIYCDWDCMINLDSENLKINNIVISGKYIDTLECVT